MANFFQMSNDAYTEAALQELCLNCLMMSELSVYLEKSDQRKRNQDYESDQTFNAAQVSVLLLQTHFSWTQKRVEVWHPALCS